MIESFQDYRLRHDIARIVAVGADYVTVVIEIGRAALQTVAEQPERRSLLDLAGAVDG